MKDKTMFLLTLVLISNLILVAYGCYNIFMAPCHSPNCVHVAVGAAEHVDTFLIHDTIRFQETIEKPILKERIITMVDTVKADTVLTYESKHFTDTLNLGGSSAVLDAFVSGVDCRLDSAKISAEIPTLTTVIEKTQYVEKKKRFIDRFHVGPSVGVGYGLINKKPDLYVGLALTVEI